MKMYIFALTALAMVAGSGVAQAGYDAPTTATGAVMSIDQVAEARLGNKRLVVFGERRAEVMAMHLVDADGVQDTGGASIVDGHTLDENGYRLYRVMQPRLTELDNGNVLFTFIANREMNGSQSSHWEIYGRVISPTVTPDTGKDAFTWSPVFRITDMGDHRSAGVGLNLIIGNYSVARNENDGTIMLAWGGTEVDSSGNHLRGIFAQRLGSDGRPAEAYAKVAPLANYLVWTSLAFDTANNDFVIAWSQLADPSGLKGARISGDLASIGAPVTLVTPRPHSNPYMLRNWHSAMMANNGQLFVAATDSGEEQVIACWFDSALNPISSCDDILSSPGGSLPYTAIKLARIGDSNAALMQVLDRDSGKVMETIVDLTTTAAVVHSGMTAVASTLSSSDNSQYMPVMNSYPFATAIHDNGHLLLLSHADGATGGFGLLARRRDVTSDVDLAVVAHDTSAIAGDNANLTLDVSVLSGTGEVASLAGVNNATVSVTLPAGLSVSAASGCAWNAIDASCTISGFLAAGASTSVTLTVDTSAFAGVAGSHDITMSTYPSLGSDTNVTNNDDTLTLTLSGTFTPLPGPLSPVGAEHRDKACQGNGRGGPKFCN